MRFAFIAKHRSIWPGAWLCGAWDVSRSGFDAWLNRSPSKGALEDESLLDVIRGSFLGSDRSFGARRVRRDAMADGMDCDLYRNERLMKRNALKVRRRRRYLPPDTSDRIAASVAPNVLDRQCHAPAPNRK